MEWCIRLSTQKRATCPCTRLNMARTGVSSEFPGASRIRPSTWQPVTALSDTEARAARPLAMPATATAMITVPTTESGPLQPAGWSWKKEAGRIVAGGDGREPASWGLCQQRPRPWSTRLQELRGAAASYRILSEERGAADGSGGRSTTPEALYWWLRALVRGRRPAGGVSPLWRAAAACERLRRTFPGELVG